MNNGNSSKISINTNIRHEEKNSGSDHNNFQRNNEMRNEAD